MRRGSEADRQTGRQTDRRTDRQTPRERARLLSFPYKDRVVRNRGEGLGGGWMEGPA